MLLSFLLPASSTSFPFWMITLVLDEIPGDLGKSRPCLQSLDRVLQTREGHVRTEASLEGCGHKPRNPWGHLKVKEIREGLLLEPWRENSPPNVLILSSARTSGLCRGLASPGSTRTWNLFAFTPPKAETQAHGFLPKILEPSSVSL